MKSNLVNRSANFCVALVLTSLCLPQLGCYLEPEGGRPTPITQGDTHGDEADNSDPAGQKTVSVKINTMTCVAGCFNGIQTVLKKRPGIQEVKLAPQANDEGQVDNSVILITYQGELDRTEIERSVLGAGFESIEFLEEDSKGNASEAAVN